MSKESDILAGYVSSELQRLSGKANFYKVDLPVPEGDTWETVKSQRLESFLTQHPLPKDDKDFPLWGAAYECAWGIKVPQEIEWYKGALKVKKRTGMKTTPMEDIWATLMVIDTDSF